MLTRPISQRLGGVEAAAGEDELHRPLLADHPREPLGAAAAGDDPEGDLRLAELGVSEATIMSQASASSQPPPSAQPETAAISGVLIAARRRQKRCRRVA